MTLKALIFDSLKIYFHVNPLTPSVVKFLSQNVDPLFLLTQKLAEIAQSALKSPLTYLSHGKVDLQ